MLTDGLAGAERRMIGIIGLHQKSARERNFPLGLLEKGLKVKIEAAWITWMLESFEIFLRCPCRINIQLMDTLYLYSSASIFWLFSSELEQP